MVFEILTLARRSLNRIVVLGLCGWTVQGDAASCDPSLAELPQKMVQGYFRPATPLGSMIEHIGGFYINDQYAGLLIQSFAFDTIKCKWLAVASISRKPETVAIWEFPSVAPYLSEQVSRPSQDFSHPQDLSLSNQGGVTELWLPDRARKGVSRFQLNSGGQIKNVKNYRLSITPIRGFFSSISMDGQYLVTMGGVGKGMDVRQRVNVYKRQDIVGSEAGSSLSVKPIYTWTLDPAQQEHKQWRQGLAVVGRTVFVLSGNGRANQTKLLGSYRLEGGTIAMDDLPSAKSNQLMKGKVRAYEPEGLEVIRHNGVLALAFGMAGGTKGNRSFDVWVVPLAKEVEFPRTGDLQVSSPW